MERIIFKKGINKIIIPALASYEMKELANKEIKNFLAKYKINKNAEIGFEYSGGDLHNIIIYRNEKFIL